MRERLGEGELFSERVAMGLRLAGGVDVEAACRAFGVAPGAPAFEWSKICAGVAVILGHNYTCWLRFKGS